MINLIRKNQNNIDMLIYALNAILIFRNASLFAFIFPLLFKLPILIKGFALFRVITSVFITLIFTLLLMMVLKKLSNKIKYLIIIIVIFLMLTISFNLNIDISSS